MPSQQVLDKLRRLQEELETTSVAIRHIDEAAKVAKAASDILKEISYLISGLKLAENEHRNELLKDHKEKIGSIEKQLKSLLSDLSTKSEQVSQLIEETRKVEKAISGYLEEIMMVNFPDRLDKVDNQVSSINIGVGNLQTTIHRLQEIMEKGLEGTNINISRSLEKAISDLTTHTTTKATDIIKQLTEQDQILKKELKTNRIIQIIGLTVILILILYGVFRP